MNKIKEIAAYCRKRCDEWDDMVSIALGYMGRKEPVPNWIKERVTELVTEWCGVNEVALDFFEDWDKIVEDVIYGNVV